MIFETQPMSARLHRRWLVVPWLAVCWVGCAEAASERTTGPSSAAANGSSSNAGNGADNPGLITRGAEVCLPSCSDFPKDPLFDTEQGSAPPMDAARRFGPADDFTTPGACVIEPQLSNGATPGTLFPSNWLRPRFRWTALPGENLWEIRISALRQTNPLVAYTTRTSWKFPRDIWQILTQHSVDTPITVTIRGVDKNAAKKPSGTRGDFMIAPSEARGKLVYWATTSSEVKPDTSKLVGFDVGDEATIDALKIAQAGDRKILSAGGRELRGKNDDPKGVPPGNVQCIGCHVSTPDGDAVAFTDHWPWNSVLASVEAGMTGALPSYVTAGAAMLLNQPWQGMQTFSKAHFRSADRVVVGVYSPRNAGQGDVGFSDSAPYPSHRDRLAWFDLETSATFTATDPSRGDVQQQLNALIRAEAGKSFGLLALDGETRSAAAPSFSHDGTRIVYTSADATQDGRLSGNNQEVDVHIVPYADRKGGQVTPLQGASEPHVAEYYPSFSADDGLVAFNRVAKIDSAPMYYRPDGEIYVVPSQGGTATRLAANDPPACTGQKSPGVINSWAKWSPRVTTVPPTNAEFGLGARTYYWLVFSSARAYEGQFDLPKTQYSPSDTRASQLYVSVVVRHEATGKLETYPALYIWNQEPNTSNLTPAWDEFKIPPVPGPD
jgi:hypothetical protein